MIASKLELRLYLEGEKIIEKEEEGFEMFIIYQGEVLVYSDKEGE